MADHGIDLEAVRAKLGSHSIFAPSASAMWMNCAGSLIANLLADDDAGEDAAYGTVGHGVGELWLKTGIRPDHLIGRVETVDEGHAKFDILIDRIMLNYVEQYVNWCNMLPGDHYVEKRVDFSRLTPIDRQSGTADHIACSPGVMVITDLKMGKGFQVFAKGNSQGLLYALGAYFKWDPIYHFEKIIIRIAQPRLGHWDEWEITLQDLLDFADLVIERALAAWEPNAPRTAGIKQCQWCKVRASCAERALWIYNILDGAFDDMHDPVTMLEFFEMMDNDTLRVQLVPARELSMAQKVKIIAYRKSIENWLKDIEDDLERQLHAGKAVPQRKLVAGRGSRVFLEKDPLKLADTLEMISGVPASEFLKTDVVGITKIEEVLQNKGGYRGKDLPSLFEGFVLKLPGKPVMAPEWDRRPAINPDDDNEFEVLGGEDIEGDFEVLPTDDL